VISGFDVIISLVTRIHVSESDILA